MTMTSGGFLFGGFVIPEISEPNPIFPGYGIFVLEVFFLYCGQIRNSDNYV